MSEEHSQKDLDLDQSDSQEQDQAQGEELRAKLAEDLGLDPEEHGELLDRAYERELKQREITAKAIQQKQKYRKQLEEFQKASNKFSQNGNVDFEKIAEQKALEILERRDLQSLNLPEDLQQEVQELAKFKGISVSEAAKLPYIQSRKEELDREERLKNASPSGKNRGVSNGTHNPNQPPQRTDYGMDKEGSEAYRKDLEAYYKKMS